PFQTSKVTTDAYPYASRAVSTTGHRTTMKRPKYGGRHMHAAWDAPCQLSTMEFLEGAGNSPGWLSCVMISGPIRRVTSSAGGTKRAPSRRHCARHRET